MALFKTTSDLVGFVPARLTLKIEDMLPVFRSVEQEYLAEQVLGQQQYDQLHTAYQANTMTSAETALLAQCRPVVAHMAIVHSAQSNSLQLTSGGWMVARGEKLDVASQNRIEALKAEQFRLGYRALDRLVAFMFENQSDYGLFIGTDALGLVEGYVTSTREFMRWVTAIGNSGYLFMRLRPIIRSIENETIRSLVCSDELHAMLMSESGNGVYTGYNQPVIELIRPAVCHAAMDRGITELSLVLSLQGVLTIEQAAGSGDGTSNLAKPADLKRLDALQLHFRTQAAHYMKLAKDKLQELAAAGHMPLYEASACYDDPDSAEDDVDPARGKSEDDKLGGFL